MDYYESGEFRQKAEDIRVFLSDAPVKIEYGRAKARKPVYYLYVTAPDIMDCGFAVLYRDRGAAIKAFRAARDAAREFLTAEEPPTLAGEELGLVEWLGLKTPTSRQAGAISYYDYTPGWGGGRVRH